MTRANFEIVYDGQSVKLQMGGDGYPENVLPIIENIMAKFENHCVSFTFGEIISKLFLFPGHVGNFCYYYKIDLDTETVTCWESNTYWVNAPKDWKEKGWSCWMGKNGKYGYTNWRKGKKVFA
jgi:hypothetical protein